MKRSMSSVAGIVGLACALALVPSASQAGGKYKLSLGAENPGVQSTVNGGMGVDCETLLPCARVRSFGPTCDPDGEQPAIWFTNLMDTTVHVEAQFYTDVLDCSGDFDLVTGDLDEMAGPGGVRLIFSQPPPQDAQYSIIWRINNCPQVACQAHINGSFPEFCPRVRF